MKLPQYSRIAIEELPKEVQKWISLITDPVNSFMLTVKNGLNNGLTVTDNMAGGIKTVSVVGGVAEFSYKSFSQPQAVIVGNIVDVSSPSYTPLSKSQIVFTADASDVCTSVAHGLVEGETVQVFTYGTIPTGLVAGTLYYVKYLTADTFSLSLTSRGTAVDISAAGAGTHVVVPPPHNVSMRWTYTGSTIQCVFYGLIAGHKYNVTLVIFDN